MNLGRLAYGFFLNIYQVHPNLIQEDPNANGYDGNQV